MKHKFTSLLSMGLTCCFLSSCGDQSPSTVGGNQKPSVYTVNYPLAYFAERIAGDQVDVVFPEMEGDPVFWEPSVEQVAEFQKANLILLNGATYAKWTDKVSLPQASLVNTSSSFEQQFIEGEEDAAHSHGPGSEHSHGVIAFTTWLDLKQAVLQAEAIDKRLGVANSGFDQLKKDLLELDQEWEKAFARFTGQPLLGSHPVYQYLSRRYQLALESVHWEPDVAPDAAMWEELETVLKSHPAKVMLWEGEPLPETEERLAGIGIQSIVFDPCGNRPDTGDFLSVLRQNAKNLEAASIQPTPDAAP